MNYIIKYNQFYKLQHISLRAKYKYEKFQNVKTCRSIFHKKTIFCSIFDAFSSLFIYSYLFEKVKKKPPEIFKGEGSIKSNFLLCNYGFFQYNELSPSKIDLLFIKW